MSLLLRTISSIAGLLLIAGSALIIIPLWVIPNTFLHQLVPVLSPLHQALACETGETIHYDYNPRGTEFSSDSGMTTHYRCVDSLGRERDVDDKILGPANTSFSTLLLGVILFAIPLALAIRDAAQGKSGAEAQAAIQMGVAGMRQSLNEAKMTQNTSTIHTAPPLSSPDNPMIDQLRALEQLYQQGAISQAEYAAGRQRILDTFAKS